MLKSSARSAIRLRGVRHNNLKNFDLDLPLNQLIVVTGLSGSGKSSLAFDTLFAEGQRRYIETFSPYARQFLDRMDKPQVDSIEGIPPAIAIEQRNAVKTTRSTVGTMTEICDYMKMLWPHVAQLFCRQCGRPVRKEPPQQIWETLQTESDLRTSERKLPQNTLAVGSAPQTPRSEWLVTFDVPLTERLTLQESLALIARQGYQRLLVDGAVVTLDEAPTRISHLATRSTQHASPPQHLTVVQDRLRLTSNNRARFTEACEQAYHFGKGKLTLWECFPPSTLSNPRLFSNRLHCAQCDIEYREPSPALFSFNHPVGACPKCRGFGRVISIDYNLVLPDRSKTLAQGVVKPWLTGTGAESQRDLLKMCRHFGVPTNIPFQKLEKKWQDLVIEGEPDYGIDDEHQWPRAWYGVKGYFRWLESKAYKMHVRVLLSRYRAYTPCPDCRGKRFQPESLLYRVSTQVEHHPENTDLTLADFYQLPVRDAFRFIEALKARHQHSVNDPLGLVLNEVHSRLGFLAQVGLGYLTLERPTRSLSGGETERVNLTTCLGTCLVNTLFVLDEPSVGLHPRDTERLVRILQQLRNAGNTVLVVEHEASVMRAADQLIDLGPGHGAAGGNIVFQGTFPQILKSKASLTGQYLSGRRQIQVPERRPVILEPHRLPPPGPVRYRGINSPHTVGASSQSLRASASSRTSSPKISPEILSFPPPNAFVLNDSPASTPPPTLTLSHATRHNLNELSVQIPLGRFVCITGVSGSGKTTLIREVLLPVLTAKLNSQSADVKAPALLVENQIDEEDSPAAVGSPAAPRSAQVEGWEHLTRVVLVDQSILGKTPRSNPAVYIGAFDDIRELFAQSELAKQRGLNASAFSFNSAQGQCERCRGAGFEKIEMQFLSDIFIRCPDCDGRRYRSHILEVKIRGPQPEDKKPDYAAPRTTHHASPSMSIADLLDSTVDEVLDFLSRFGECRPALRAVQSLKLLQEVGLGYLKLGQPINTLSGGESQRLKLVRHLAEANLETRFAHPHLNAATNPACVPSFPLSRSGGEPWRQEVISDLDSVKPGTTGPHEQEDPLGKPQRSRPLNSTLFMFDEPTTGLHFDDIRILLKVFQRLVDGGHSVLVIEHNLDVIKSADWLIDLGPDAGDQGGQIVAEGTPEQVAACDESHTGRVLRELAKDDPGLCTKE